MAPHRHMAHHDDAIVYLSPNPRDREALVAAVGHSVDNPVQTCEARGALEQYLEERPGLALVILVDCMIDGAPFGIDVVRALRMTYGERTDTPIMAVLPAGLDVATRDTLERAARDAGAAAVLRKPITAEDLVLSLGRPGWSRIRLERGAPALTRGA